LALRIDAPELAGLLTYPRFDEGEYARRLDELRGLGVQSLMTGGRTTIGGVRIAGKGNVGLVIKAHAAGEEKICALKIRRVDANRGSMRDEVSLHTIANGAGVGPRLLGHSDNFMLMGYAGERSIADWAADVDRESAAAVARSVLEQCYRLDRAGIDHGELSHLDNHVIVSDDDGGGMKATVIDFESASTGRKVSNVSAAGQSLLVSGVVAASVGRALAIDRDRAIAALKKYKWEQTRENFDALLSILER
jgi:putative serine/threonine protein kinase